MSTSEDMSDEKYGDDKKKYNQKNHNEPQTVRFHGKDIEIKKFKQKMNHKPRILGIILINISIIIVLIIIILLII